MDSYIRKLGVFVKVLNGKINVEQEYQLCKKGEPITADQSKILRLLKVKLGKFKLFPIYYYNIKGEFLKLGN